MPNRLLTAKETAQRLNISYGTLRNILSEKPEALPKPLIIGTRRRWSEKAVDEWIESNSQRT